MINAILVTGAAGFIGSHVTEALLERGDIVVGLDNLNDYYDPARKRANWHEATAESESTQSVFVHGDVRDRAMITRVFDQHPITRVIHLAAMAGVRVSIEDPHLYYAVNLTGTLNLLEEARRRGIESFVLASTSSVYGDTQVIPFVESDRCDLPLAPYPASKRAAEMLGYTYHHLHGLSFTALRFFTVYGSRGRPDMMAYKVLDNIFHGLEVPLYNSGQMHRDWTYVSDTVDGILRASDAPLGYEVINLGRGEPVLLADFVGLVERVAGRKASLTPMPMQPADVMYTYADISKARRLLGYDPKVSVEEGVERLWDWYQRTVLTQR